MMPETALHLKISSLASEDLISLLAHSELYFGVLAKQRYEKLIFKALDQLLQAPECIGSKAINLSQIEKQRSYHLSSVKRNTGVHSPRHMIVYCVRENELQIKRVLHEAMDLTTQFEDPTL